MVYYNSWLHVHLAQVNEDITFTKAGVHNRDPTSKSFLYRAKYRITAISKKYGSTSYVGIGFTVVL